jgi:mitogen-activated protein kinase kinase kinase 7
MYQYFNINRQLQPIAPCPTSPESIAIYQKHCQLAKEYMQMESEITFLDFRKKELSQLLEQEDKTMKRNAAKLKQDYSNLLNENEQLKLLQSNLQKQVEQIKNHRQNQLGGGLFVDSAE